jgi:hypothetical protein
VCVYSPETSGIDSSAQLSKSIILLGDVRGDGHNVSAVTGGRKIDAYEQEVEVEHVQASGGGLSSSSAISD